jgi:phenylalanyl-tRNA synthetase alpha chain
MSSPHYLSPEQLRRDLAVRDLCDPSDGAHAIQDIASRAVAALSRAWDCEVRWCRGPRVVPVADNYDRLGYAAQSVTREARYTRYVDAGRMLRSHSSAMVPPALRQLAAESEVSTGSGAARDVLLVCPGIVYRRDAIDWQHTGTPHQLDLWRITSRPMTGSDLDQMIAALLEALVPGMPSAQHDRVHPYTVGGRQVDVRTDERWVEVWECGLAHPGVLAAAGLAGHGGLALGMGLDRMLMLVKGIADIRLLRSADPRVARQMLGLARYRPVSAMPAIVRDMSIAVRAGEDEETLGDRVREALGPDAACIEEVRVLSATPCSQLPPAALERIGASPDQQNLLVRVVLRDLDATLTRHAANDLRNRIYQAIHAGTRQQLAGTGRRAGQLDRSSAAAFQVTGSTT